MKTSITLIALLFTFLTTYAQDFTEHIVFNENSIVVRKIDVGDMDNDGDMDIVAVKSPSTEGVVWFENTDGQGNFSQPLIIDSITNNDVPRLIKVADIDGDGLEDVVVQTDVDGSPDKVVWYKNLDGQGNFGEEQVIDSSLIGVTSIHHVDIDDDGDEDVFITIYDQNKVAWYENLDGNGTFGSQQIIFNFNAAWFVNTADFDGDGDKDVVALVDTGNVMYWVENTDGQGMFGSEQLISDMAVDNPSSDRLSIGDIDGDGDIDIVVYLGNTDEMVWFENFDGQGQFNVPANVIGGSLGMTKWPTILDINGDGTQDIVYARLIGTDSYLGWFSNQGEGNFGNEGYLASGLDHGVRDLCSADINGDGSEDVISAGWISGGEGEIAWYENPFTLSVDSYGQDNVGVYPTPTTGVLKIETTGSVPYQARVYTPLGQLVLSKQLETETLDISVLAAGHYILKLTDPNGKVSTKKVVKI